MKGLMFKPDMLQATIEDRKKVTRRLSGLEAVNVEPDDWTSRGYVLDWRGFHFTSEKEPNVSRICRPRYLPGETVYLKETWADMVCVASTVKGKGKGESSPIYKFSADSTELKILARHWRSPMFMPEWAARYHVKIKSVRPERLRDITAVDALREGISLKKPYIFADLKVLADFYALWNSINAKPKPVKVKGILDHYVSYPWESGTRTETYRGKPHYIRGNAWVWRIEYERVG